MLPSQSHPPPPPPPPMQNPIHYSNDDPAPRPHKPIDTGFPEPFSEDRNTTLRHPAAIPAISTSHPATVDMSQITDERKRRLRFPHRHHQQQHRDSTSEEEKEEEEERGGMMVLGDGDEEDAVLYRGLREEDVPPGEKIGGEAGNGGKREGRMKRALKRLSCGSM